MTDTDERPKILVVDDEPLNIELLAGALEDDGEVTFATSGEEALDMALADPPDIVLLDVEMPGMGGYETCRRLKAEPSLAKVPVVFVTGHGDIASAETGLALGASDYLTKPIGVAITRKRVANLVQLKRCLEQLEQRDAAAN